MEANPFFLTTVLDRLPEIDEGIKIETLELSVGSLFIGTSAGQVIQYGLSERRDKDKNTVFEASRLGTRDLGEGSVTWLHAAPVINTLLAFCNSCLHILDMSNLATRPLSGANKLKGLTALSPAPPLATSAASPLDSVRVCTAKKRQLFLVTVAEDRLTLGRSFELPEPIAAVSADGGYAVLALASQYAIINLETGAVQPLFGIEDPRHAVGLTVRGVDREEFLVAGPGQLGVFVAAAGGGTSTRPPVQWGGAGGGGTGGEEDRGQLPKRVVFSPPSHLVAVVSGRPNQLAVYSTSDNKLKQGIPFPDARHVGCYDGTLLAASSSHVVALLPVPWQVRAEQLLQTDQGVEEALHLAQEVLEAAGPSLDRETRAEVDIVRQRAAFSFLSQGEWSSSREYLLLGRTDPREVICLFPGMLSSNSKFCRQSPPLHTITDISSIQKCEGDVTVEAREFLLTYLQHYLDMEQIATDDGLLEEEVSTAVARLLALLQRTEEFTAFLDRGNLTLNYQELSSHLTELGQPHLLSLVHLKFQRPEEAASTWASILKGNLPDTSFPGLEYFCRQLSSLQESLVWEHCDTCLVSDEEEGVKVFTLHPLNREREEFRERALNVLAKYSRGRLRYLHHLVFELESEKEAHHTQLALGLIDSLAGGGAEQLEQLEQLRHLMLGSGRLNSRYLLQQLEGTDLHYERAILHGQLGEYDRSLDILVNKLADYKLAEQFCDDLSANKPKELRQRLLFLLLTTYLTPQPPHEPCTVQAVDLINTRAAHFDSVQVLRSLPESWNLATILPGLRVLMRDQVHNQRMTAISRQLAKGESVQTKVRLMTLTQAPVTIFPNNYCLVCKKGLTLGDGGTVRYPSGVMVHAVGCADTPAICPLTGQVFSLVDP